MSISAIIIYIIGISLNIFLTILLIIKYTAIHATKELNDELLAKQLENVTDLSKKLEETKKEYVKKKKK